MINKMGMNTVQELAESLSLPSDHFIQKEDNRLNGDIPVATDIPVIDLSCISQNNKDELEKLRHAVQSWGVFQVINHGVEPSFIDEVQDTGKKFFKLPKEVKEKKSDLNSTLYDTEGYGNYNVVRKENVKDWNDRLRLTVLPEHKRKIHLWPENPPSFRGMLREYTMQTRKLADVILLAFAKVLNLEENYFVDILGESAEVTARFNYYPQCAKPDLVLGLHPHADSFALTILLPDREVDGLQVRKDGKWFRVPIIPHAFVINMGYQSEVMSNGIIKSVVHRVAANTKERLSVTMFFGLDQEKILEPAQGLVSESRPKLYKTIKVKDFVNMTFEKFEEGVSSIEWAKI